jgi:branched-chain amino acid aminotransferase
MHRLILHNDDLRDAAEACTSPGQVGLMNGWGVFSTLRVVDGVLFAFERHLARMSRDAELLHVPFPKHPEWLHGRLLNLVEANRAFDATLRVCVVRNQGGPFEGPLLNRTFDVVAFTTELTRWPASVSLALKRDARHARNEFSGVKVMSWAFNLTWNEEARARGFDEVVLLNERGEISECTSANLFAVAGDRVWTPPLDSGCLPGVTRAILLEEVRVAGVAIAEKPLLPSDLETVDGVFMTSSTRDVLPIRNIEGLEIRQGGRLVMEALGVALQDRRNEYVQQAENRAVKQFTNR